MNKKILLNKIRNKSIKIGVVGLGYVGLPLAIEFAYAGFKGQIDIDIFEIDGEYYISEVNPRFGGGYPHAYECGVNNMKLILKNLRGFNNEMDTSYKDGVYMMKYNEIATYSD